MRTRRLLLWHHCQHNRAGFSARIHMRMGARHLLKSITAINKREKRTLFHKLHKPLKPLGAAHRHAANNTTVKEHPHHAS